MATIVQRAPEISAEPVNYLNVSHTWKSWLFTTDHKRIAVLYLISITLMFVVGGAAAVAFRINLLST
jgi:cytochrome c oxidase subunit I